MNEITYFQCSYCKQQYANKQQAIDCEKQPIEKPCVEVGQIVEMCFGYGWFDGDKRWVINLDKKNAPRITEHGNCFDRCCTMGFWTSDCWLFLWKYSYYSAESERDRIGWCRRGCCTSFICSALQNFSA